MQNVGTWNSDFAIFLFFMMMLPMVINSIAKMINSLPPAKDIIHSPDVLPDVVRLDNHSLQIIQVRLTSIKNQLNSQASSTKPKPKSKKRPTPNKNRRRKSTINTKDKKIQQEASIALNRLGVKKSEANSIVKNLYKEKAYSSSEDLLKDAIVYIG
jgi:hypothetical protein